MLWEVIIRHIYHRAFIYELITILITYSILMLAHLFFKRYRRYKILSYYGFPGPKPNLLDGSWLEYDYYGCKLENDNKMMEKYGKTYGFYLGDEACVMTTDLDLLKAVFIEEMKTFSERSKTVIDIPLTRGLLYARYPRWKLMRGMLSPAFAKFHRRGGSSSQFVENTLKELLNYVNTKYETCLAKNEACIVDIRNLTKATSLHLINTMAIGLPGIEVREHEPYVEAMDTFIDEGNRGLVVLAIIAPVFRRIFSFFMRHFELHPMFAKIHKRLDEIIQDGLIKLRKQIPGFESHEKSFEELKDVHTLQKTKSSANLMALNSNNNSNNNNNTNNTNKENQSNSEEQVIDTMVRLLHIGWLSRKELYGTAEIILMAGYDTTATTLTYTFWVIANDQAMQNKLRSSLLAHGIESQYLKQIINETMRLYPVAPYIATRLATKSITIKQWTIPEGTKVHYNSWLVHRDPDIWPDPLKFDPERFREGVELHPCAFAPFGLGEKRCLAYQLAQLEMKMIICDLLLRYKMKVVSPKTLDIEPIGFVTTQPKEKVLIELERIN